MSQDIVFLDKGMEQRAEGRGQRVKRDERDEKSGETRVGDQPPSPNASAFVNTSARQVGAPKTSEVGVGLIEN
jgi:hypothetical protein